MTSISSQAGACVGVGVVSVRGIVVQNLLDVVLVVLVFI